MRRDTQSGSPSGEGVQTDIARIEADHGVDLSRLPISMLEELKALANRDVSCQSLMKI